MINVKRILILLVAVLYLVGCDFLPFGEGDHERGYKDGWAGNFSIGSSDQYKKGYEEGKRDANMYEQGYKNAESGLPKGSKYETSKFYRDGYDDATEGKPMKSGKYLE